MPTICPVPVIGTIAARPTATIFGPGVYFAYDTGVTYISDGKTWYGEAGALLAKTFFAPSVAASYPLVVSTTGLTRLDASNILVNFVAPASGSVMVRLTGFVKGAAAAATSVVFGIVSTTASPGTVVGVTGLVYLTPTATAADNGAICSMTQTITGLTPGAHLTWYMAAMYSGTQPSVIAQGVTAATTVPTGAPAGMEVWAA